MSPPAGDGAFPLTACASLSLMRDVLAFYSTLINGQVWRNADLIEEEKLAIVLCAAEVLAQAHRTIAAEIMQRRQTGPAWTMSRDKIAETAGLIAWRMMDG